MGRCLAFNFSPDELKRKLESVRYFVYTPDYDSAGYTSDQHFYAVVDTTNQDVESMKATLTEKLQLKGSVLQFFETKDRKLFIELASSEPHGAITLTQIADVLLADQELGRMNLTAAPFVRNQDIVFGENHFLAKEFSKPFRHTGGLYVPHQDKWYVGENYQEARSKFEAGQNK